ncbi:hypothetical protein [Methanolobus tindarius]|nr:hypothetical protein [Methanolobus tindarius]
MYQPQGHTIPSDQNSRTCGLAPQLSDGTNSIKIRFYSEKRLLK